MGQRRCDSTHPYARHRAVVSSQFHPPAVLPLRQFTYNRTLSGLQNRSRKESLPTSVIEHGSFSTQPVTM
jgi:hypothetical protein